jgi:molecular chaperone HscB
VTDAAGEFMSRHLCPGCGSPRPILEGETYFAALGAPEKFLQDQAALQKRFYEVSRALHPDRFTASSVDVKRFSLDRMSFINDAYRTLRTPAELREYILELHGMKAEAGARGQIPMELAEGWFELQDAISENPESAEAQIGNFKNDLAEFKNKSESKMSDLEKKLDALENASPAFRQGLQDLSRAIQETSYLISLGRDVERIEQRTRK